MKYSVYHAINPTFMDSKVRLFPTEFNLVAEVECETLERLFELTNHIHSDWTTNPEVKWRSGNGKDIRSTSVGDMVVDEKLDIFLCKTVGWKHYGNMDEI